jgi:Co/Zn/Cd efflux system component
VLFGAVGVWLGYLLADPIVGLLITAAIFAIVIQSAKSIFLRMLDGAEPQIIAEIRHAPSTSRSQSRDRGAGALARSSPAPSSTSPSIRS